MTTSLHVPSPIPPKLVSRCEAINLFARKRQFCSGDGSMAHSLRARKSPRHLPVTRIVLAGATFLLIASTAPADDRKIGATGSAELPRLYAQANGGAIIIVNAADGPTLETREALRNAQEQGIPAVALRIEHLELIQDEELTELITEELYAIAGEYGYDESRVSIVKCSGACD